MKRQHPKVYKFTSTVPAVVIMSKVELEYLFTGIKNGEYILSTYYYYPAPVDVSGVKDGQDEFSVMKTVNEESNKEKISIPYGAKVEDTDTISIEGGELSLSVRKNSSGPAVMSVMMLDELEESVEPAAMSIKQMKLKDIEKFEIASKNIFRHTLVMQFVTAGEKDISIKIYNKLGSECRKLFDGKSKDGYNAIIWDGKDGKGGMLASGEYFVVYESGNKRVVKKVELIK
ncbi:MAG: FlgD immunoglobulin-like domain containing protein [bacterium]|nr:FlgD immunoglobulin-like domain containing protein [bacterium]